MSNHKIINGFVLDQVYGVTELRSSIDNMVCISLLTKQYPLFYILKKLSVTR